MGENLTLKGFEEKFKKENEVKEYFMLPINNLLLELKLVERDRERKNVKTPYIKAEIVIPPEIGKSIGEVLNSDWKLVLMGIKFEKVKK